MGRVYVEETRVGVRWMRHNWGKADELLWGEADKTSYCEAD